MLLYVHHAAKRRRQIVAMTFDVVQIQYGQELLESELQREENNVEEKDLMGSHARDRGGPVLESRQLFLLLPVLDGGTALFADVDLLPLDLVLVEQLDSAALADRAGAPSLTVHFANTRTSMCFRHVLSSCSIAGD
jgi:hypothetical protein